MKQFILSSFFILLSCGLASGAEFNRELQELLMVSSGRFDAMPRVKTYVQSSLLSGGGVPDQVLLFGRGDTAAIVEQGGVIQTSVNGYFTAMVPVSSLETLRLSDRVAFLHYGPKAVPLLDAAVPFISADQTYAAGYRGENVIIGVIDTGIDINHPDFKNDSGRTRILNVWEQTALSGTPPSGFTYGREWSKDDIDAGRCTMHDSEFHGTHVSGIAAGNGSASTNLYHGAAPNANIVFVKLDFNNINAVIDGVAYIFSKAKYYNLPCVINLSLGHHSGPHSRYDDFNQAMDSLVAFYGSRGRIIVWAAGNEGSDPLHATNFVSTNSNTAITVNYSVNPAYIDFWFTNLPVSIAVVDPLGTTNLDYTDASSIGGIYRTYQNFSVVSVSNGVDHGVSFILYSQTNGLWKFLFKKGAASFPVDGYIVNYDPGSMTNSFANPVYSGTVSATACQYRSISVAALISKTNYTDYMGATHYTTNQTGSVAYFSSIGPTRDGQPKPEISAPGSIVVSTLNTYFDTSSIFKINSYYFAMQGTSMAAPLVTGAIALILEKAPLMTVEEVREKLIQNCRGNAFKTDPQTWDGRYGYGIIDVGFVVTMASAQQLVDVFIRGNVLNTRLNPNSRCVFELRNNYSTSSSTVSVKMADRYGNTVRYLGGGQINGTGVTQYEWNGKNQFDYDMPPGVYFALVTIDSSVYRFTVLVNR